MSDALAGRRIVVPETRELDLLADMLERHGATAVRCPLVAIRDVADAVPVEAWLKRFIAAPPDDLILLTGEGLGRLVGFAARAGIETAFVATLAKVRKITRGPKPARRLQMLGLKPDLPAPEPTTAGVIAALEDANLAGRRIAVQLYPDPNPALLEFLTTAGATPDPVLCYAYASESEDRLVAETIDAMAAGKIDLIAFTSSAQVKRLRDVATASARAPALRAALARTRIAAVGPVVAEAIEQAGGHVTVAPEQSFHLKPMVNAIVAAIGS
ncbi:MAG: uroporphyrinogen-III synthase [Hyphomicrobiales bacterium]|nr:uroporphyrinogen-III synthase [Hyphomicrobiales bacterium]MBV8825849.1 uroporphyrinogen-III synthase [Hyphomicrobiales bacterium]